MPFNPGYILQMGWSEKPSSNEGFPNKRHDFELKKPVNSTEFKDINFALIIKLLYLSPPMS
jgi:hypothetical protein